MNICGGQLERVEERQGWTANYQSIRYLMTRMRIANLRCASRLQV